jgi:hypothetical protein
LGRLTSRLMTAFLSSLITTFLLHPIDKKKQKKKKTDQRKYKLKLEKERSMNWWRAYN